MGRRRKRGAMFGTSPHDTPRNLEVIDRAVNEWGMNLLRWQIGYFPEGVLNKPAYLDHVKGHVQEIKAASNHIKEKGYDIKLCIDLHHVPGGEVFALNRFMSQHAVFKVGEWQDLFLTVWQIIATEFKNDSTIWAYDVINEPKAGKSKLNKLYTKVIGLIRGIDSKARIVLEPPLGDPLRINQIDYIKDDVRIVYSPHMYFPMSRSHQGVFSNFPFDQDYPDPEFKKAELEHNLRRVISYQQNNNAKIFIGEFGFVADSPQGSQANWVEDCIEIFEANNWHWCHHAMKDAWEWPGWNPRADTELVLKRAYS